MPKIDLEAVPVMQGWGYPPPYDGPCREREWRMLGAAVGLTQFGVNLVRLKPGVWSSQRHWHALEDEFVYVLAGEVSLVTDAGSQRLRTGEAAGFPAGVRDGHCLKNETDSDALVLVVGSRNDADWGEYSDIDMRFDPGRYSGPNVKRRKDGSPIA